MTNLLQRSLFEVPKIAQQFTREFHRGPVTFVNLKWRKEKKLTTNPNSFGPLTNLPDYSFKDGRTVPYGVNQKKRIDKQQEYLIKIKKLVGEIDYAVEKHQLKLKEKEVTKQNILNRKLKEKGNKLLLSSSEEKL